MQSNPTKAKNLLYFKKRLSFSFPFFRMIVKEAMFFTGQNGFAVQRGKDNHVFHVKIVSE